jgi:hypothetical protein
LTYAVDEINKARGPYQIADDYYRGKVGEVFASPKIQALLGKSAQQYKVNLAKKPVNAVLNGLEITSVMVPNAQGKPDENLTNELQTKVWQANELDMYAPDIHREVGSQGDAYVIVWDGEEDNTVEVHMCKPLGARMFYDEENPKLKKFFAMLWREEARKRTRLNLYYPDRIERYSSTAKEPKSDKDFTKFTGDEDDSSWPIPNPHEEIPVFHGRSDHPYGVPDHYEAYGAQNAITKLLATNLASIDFVGFPQRAALMGADLDDDDGDAWDKDDNETAPSSGGIPDTDDESSLVAHPGRLWMLRNVTDLIQLPAADPDAFLKPLDKALQLMSVATETPMRFFAGSAGQLPSGASQREDDMPLTSRRYRRVLMLGAMWRDALTFAMRKILGHKDCPEVVVQWAPLDRATELDEWQTVSAKQAAGVPRDTTLQEAGYTSDQVEDWRENAPDPGEGLAPRVELLNQLAVAAEKLAAAAALGAIDMSVVQSLMAGFLPDDETAPGTGPPLPDDAGPTLREQAEMVQKIYLGVPSVLSREEARTMLAAAGIAIDPNADPGVE